MAFVMLTVSSQRERESHTRLYTTIGKPLVFVVFSAFKKPRPYLHQIIQPARFFAVARALAVSPLT